ncbi:MAG TPA: hypothetical protein P5513_04700 [Candidatus Diapherotrites archaeon]|nr:hypothetical protein [Candidatus Diapherotrites archaeon]
MIDNNALGDRLNSVRKGGPIPKPSSNPVVNLKNNMNPSQASKFMSYKNFFIQEGYKIFNISVASILYGYGIASIFSLERNFIEIFGMGFIFNHFLSILLKILNK